MNWEEYEYLDPYTKKRQYAGERRMPFGPQILQQQHEATENM
jgi:hypothetical protein